jgi:hypothetical protein
MSEMKSVLFERNTEPGKRAQLEGARVELGWNTVQMVLGGLWWMTMIECGRDGFQLALYYRLYEAI